MILVAALALATPRQDYAKAHDAWTETHRIYDGWDNALTVRATLLSAQMRDARAARTADMTGEDVVSDPSGNDSLSFVLTIATASRDDDELAGAQQAWTFHATRNGASCGPAALTRVKFPTPLDRGLNPKLTRWDTLWIARFDPCTSVGTITLTVDGPRGHGAMQWNAQ